MWKNKIGGVSSKQHVGTIIITLLALVIVVVAVAYYFKEPAETKIVPQEITTEEGKKQLTELVSCPSDGTTDGQVRYEDGLAATTTYCAGPTVYFMPKTAGKERVTAGTLSATAWSTAVDLECLESGTKWRAVAVALSGRYHSVDEGVDFTAEGPKVKRDLIGKAYGDLQVRVEDNFAGGATFFNVTGATCSWAMANTSAYTRIACGANGVEVSDLNEGAGTGSLKVDADEYIDAIFYLKTNATKRQFGEDGLKTYLLVDADPASWQEPIVGWQGGATLSDLGVSVMADEDQRKYSGYEYVYDVGIIGDREKKFTYYQQTAGGVDPGTSADPILEFCTEGRYDSSKDPNVKDEVRIGCWTDATTQVQVSSANRQKITIDVLA